MPNRPVLLLDSASLYYRSFYALPDSMTAPDGRPHNAIRGFLTTVTRLVRQFDAAGVAACWDDDWRPAWRVDLLPSYKTHRASPEESTDGAEATPEALLPQADAIAQLLDAMGIARPGATGFEADDILATLASAVNRPAIVVSGDRDLVQLVRPGVHLLLTVNGGMDKWPLLDDRSVIERFGVRPDQYVDLAVLRGDPSDGIPGVPGIGAKTATALVSAFGGLDEILVEAAAGSPQKPLTARLAGVLTSNEDLIRRMRMVATARTDVALNSDRDFDPGHVTEPDMGTLERVGAQWGVTRYVNDLRAALPG